MKTKSLIENKLDQLIGEIEQVAREIHYARSLIIKEDAGAALANLDQALNIIGAIDPSSVGLSKNALYGK